MDKPLVKGPLVVDVHRTSPYEFAQTHEPSMAVYQVGETSVATHPLAVDATVVVPAIPSWVGNDGED